MAIFISVIETVVDIPTVLAAVVGRVYVSLHKNSIHFSWDIEFLVEICGLSTERVFIEVWRQTSGC